MKTRKILCALAAAAALACVPALSFAGQSHSQHQQARELTLDKGGKWKIDEALRTGMESIRDQVAQMHLAGERAPLRAEWYRSLGLSMQQEIAAIVKNCQLDPQADANFHVVLAQLDEAAEALKGNTTADARRGMKQARETLEHYGHYFDHPGWSTRA